MSKTEDAFDVPAFINSRPIGAVQYGIVVLCGLVMFLDGLDTQAISYMAPMISKEWGLSRDVLGPIFSSALTGLMFGYLVLSPLSDKFGHRRLILFSTVTFGVLTLVTLGATNVTELMVLRFLTGIALGTAIPSTVALTTEYMPKRLRATFVLAIYCGFSLGFVAAGGLLMAGPDPTGNGGVIPGFGDQREVELLVEAGFTPVEAIRIATLNGATYLGLADRIGTIAAGKNADLFIVTGNPAAKIGDIENVVVVFKDGVGYDSAKLLQSVRGRFGQY